jgi:hypothetical protein
VIDYGDDEWPAEITGGAAPPVISDENRRITGGEPPDNFDDSERDEAGRFGLGNTAGVATQFQPGRSGNPSGRPKGSFRAGMRLAARLLDDAAAPLTRKALEHAYDGDPVAVRFCLGRILGNRRGQPVELDLPAIAEPADLGAAVGAITEAVAEGNLTPEEAMHLARMLDGFPRILAAIPPPPAAQEDYREKLIAAFDQLASRVPKEERRASLLEELAALDAEA